MVGDFSGQIDPLLVLGECVPREEVAFVIGVAPRPGPEFRRQGGDISTHAAIVPVVEVCQPNVMEPDNAWPLLQKLINLVMEGAVAHAVYDPVIVAVVGQPAELTDRNQFDGWVAWCCIEPWVTSDHYIHLQRMMIAQGLQEPLAVVSHTALVGRKRRTEGHRRCPLDRQTPPLDC